MIVLTFVTNTGLRLGAKTPAGILDVAGALSALSPIPGAVQVPTSVSALLAGGRTAQDSLENFIQYALDNVENSPSWLLDESHLHLAPAVPEPGKIICVGLNYRRHAAESGMAEPSSPVLFSKFNNAVAAPGEPVPLPDNAEQYDYEVELAVVIGRQARHVSEEDALKYVWGYCNANDVSARDLQTRTSQWLLGKSLDKFMPLGPYLVSSDEVDDPQQLRLRCWVNGQLRQNSSTADMIFSVAYLVSYISQYMTLLPGDLILTGTPEGVILGMTEKVWLKPGDEVTVEVDKLGRLTNVMSRG